ncbi:MAG: NRDE family protein [Planctomycetota bacterium]|nr:NRDE family protein [Planctomycetota bacterium]
MCTISIIPLPGGGLRAAISRDELRSRGPALPPRLFEPEPGVSALWPVDSQAGGTWVAVSARGVVFALLNGNPRGGAAPGRRSRGLLIPMLAGLPDPRLAMEHLQAIALDDFAPFRLVAASADLVLDATWDGRELGRGQNEQPPACFVSSGLGDELVTPRLTLFEQWFERHAFEPAAQDAFHDHRWPDRPDISVRMERPEARTVSVTTIELPPPGESPGQAVMIYRDDAGPRRAELSLSRPPAQHSTVRSSTRLGAPSASPGRGRVRC